MALESTIKASGINPFDRSYHTLQQQYDHKILNIILKILGINATFVQTPLVTDLMSYMENPDNWIVEQIVNGSAEISSTTIILTPESANLVDFSYGIGTFRPQLYFKAKSLREKSNIYLVPFSSKLWVCLISAVVLLTMALIFILSHESKLPHKISYDVFARIMDIQEDRDENWTDNQEVTLEESIIQKEKWEMGEILLVCLGALCQQGSARDPSTNAARLLLLVLFVLSVVGYTAYSASIISIISLFPETEHETSTDVNLSLEYDTLLHNTQRNDLYLKLGFQNTEFTSPQKAFDDVLEKKAVFIGDRDISLTVLHRLNYNSTLRCSLGRAFLGMQYQRAFAIKNNSTLKEKINYSVLQLKQSGLIERERKNIFNTRPPCSAAERSAHSNFVSFDQHDVQPVTNLFKLGLVSSIILLIVENLVYYCPKIYKKITTNSAKLDQRRKKKVKTILKNKHFLLKNKVEEQNFTKETYKQVNEVENKNVKQLFLL